MLPFPVPGRVAARPRRAGRGSCSPSGRAAARRRAGRSPGGCSYDHNLLNLQPRGLDSVAWEHKLIDRAAGATWDALSIARTREEALALKAKYEALPEVGRVVEVASLVPADQEREAAARSRRSTTGSRSCPPADQAAAAARVGPRRGPRAAPRRSRGLAGE